MLRVRLDVLSRSDAVAMIRPAAGDRAVAEPRACERLAALCGHLPLALDILARKLVERPHVPLRSIAALLADPRAALDWLRVGDLSVQESLGSACARLGQDARDVLDRLAALPGQGPVAWACGQVGGIGGRVAEESIVELADAGLIRHGDEAGAFQLDPLVRALR
ncbi:hypothetical protein ACFQV2_25995 [Actinokineospora soli]|uniref:Uncharacterized protein n=1 Tax=Actinokineospora soli TaxID=1048753 RepID=A0ABW2TUD0_9PSEU